jgi:hypothetical protein
MKTGCFSNFLGKLSFAKAPKIPILTPIEAVISWSWYIKAYYIGWSV